jgi:hypothetical protein
MKDNVMIAMLTGQPIKVAPLYNPMNGPSTQNVVNTAYQEDGLFLEGNFEKVVYMNPNGTKRKRPFVVGPEAPPIYRGPGFVPTNQFSLQGETVTPAGGIYMPPPMLNGFELALRGRMDNLPQPVSGPVRDGVFDAVASYRDMMMEDNYERKMTHLMTQGYSKEEVDEAMSVQRKQFLMGEIAKPTPVAPVTIQDAMEKLVRRDFYRPGMVRATDADPSL